MNAIDTNLISLRLEREDRAMAFDAQERLQVAAYQTACRLLHSGKDFAEQIGQKRNKDKERFQAINQPLDRIHNTIFIDGERGSGKTAFMLNLEEAYRQESDKENEALYFCQPIDPTLLSIKEDFINVLIGQLHAEIETRAHNSSNPMSESYLNALEQVVDALELEHTAKNSYGVDRLLAFKGSLEIERRLYEYFAQAKEVLQCKAIVLLIDDVDMSLDVAFNVLEVIRKYLACPFVLSVVSGDKQLYKAIINRHFIRKLAVDEHKPDTMERQEATSLASRYLQKIFPEHAEIRLQLIPALLRSHKIEITNNEQTVPFDTLHKNLRSIIFGGATHAEKFWTEFRPKTARDLVQLNNFLAGLPQEILTTLFSPVQIELEPLYSNIAFLQALYSYLNAREKIALATSVLSTIEIATHQSNQSSEILLRNISIFDTAELTDKQGDNYFAQKSSDMLKNAIYKASDSVTQEKYFRQLRPLIVNYPAVEPYSTNLLISKKRVSEVEDLGSKLLLAMYTHHDYFSSNQSGYLLFFGKIFELVFTSLIRDLDAKDISVLLHGAPYHSFFHYFATKTVNEEREDEIDEPDEQQSLHISLVEEDYQALADDINHWRQQNGQLAFSAHQIYCVFFKFFNNIQLLKSKNFILEQDLYKLHQRVSLILLNATASYEIGAEGLINQSIALNKNFHSENVVRYDSSYSYNIAPLLDSPTLTNAVYHHPALGLKGLEGFFIKKPRGDGGKPSGGKGATGTTQGSGKSTTTKANAGKSSAAKSTSSKTRSEPTSGGARVARIRALKMQNLPTIEEIISMPPESAPKYVMAAIEALINDREVNKHKAIYRQQLNDNRAFFSSFYEKAQEMGMAGPLEKWLNE